MRSRRRRSRGRRNPTFDLIKDPDKYARRPGDRTRWHGGKYYRITLNAADHARIKALYRERKAILKRMSDLDRAWHDNTDALNALGETVFDEGT